MFRGRIVYGTGPKRGYAQPRSSSRPLSGVKLCRRSGWLLLRARRGGLGPYGRGGDLPGWLRVALFDSHLGPVTEQSVLLRLRYVNDKKTALIGKQGR